jgi:hypothetical protein
MNGVLRAIPKATVYRIAGGVALLSAISAFALAALFRPYLGDVVGYVLVPLLVALLAWAIAVAARLRLVGFLPSEADHFISDALRPWIRFWLLVRLGLLGAMLLLLAAIVATAIGGGSINYCVNALVFVVIVRLLVDLVFGAAFNVGIISRRHSPS